MADYQKIYAAQADQYDAMVSAEDVDGNLPRTLASILPPGARIVDIGCGTGRVTRAMLAAAHPREVVGVEPWAAMRDVARARADALGPDVAARVHIVEGAADHLPLPDAWADAAVAGWVFGHQVSWAGERWPETIGTFLAEMRRVVRPGGTRVVIETLGTGMADHPEVARAPTPGLAAYYAWLEETHGFVRHTIDTSYGFPSVEAAVNGLGFFFGERLVTTIREQRWARVPEWTGLWVATP